MPSEIPPNIQAVLSNIQNRRSLPPQWMKSDPINETTLNQLFEAANWAPTHKLTEPWRFKVFTEAGRASLARVLGESYRATIGERFDEKKFLKTTTRPLNVPVVMAIIMAPGLKANLPEFEEILAVGCAMQNFHLAAHAMGIGCFWSTPKYLDHEPLRDFLGISGRERCLGFYYLGYPISNWPHSRRRPFQEKVQWVKQ